MATTTLLAREMYDSGENDDEQVAIYLTDERETLCYKRKFLQAYSAYFAALCNFSDSNTRKQESESVVMTILDQIPGWAVKISLDYLERVKANPNKSRIFEPEELFSLIVVSDYFQMDEFQRTMIKELIFMLDVENFSITLQFALWWEFKILLKACSEYLVENFEDLYKKNLDCFCRIPLEMLSSACQSDSIACEENVILDAIVEWLSINAERATLAEQDTLVRSIRYAWVSIDYLTRVLSVIDQVSSLKSLLNEAIAYHQSSLEQQRNQSEEYHCKPRFGRICITRLTSLDDSMKSSTSPCRLLHSDPAGFAILPFNQDQAPNCSTNRIQFGWLQEEHRMAACVVRTYPSGTTTCTMDTSVLSNDAEHLREAGVVHTYDNANSFIDAVIQRPVWQPQTTISPRNEMVVYFHSGFNHQVVIDDSEMEE